MYDVRPNLILGFHGCDIAVCHSLLNNPDKIKSSQNPFDWLGHGMYFWENNYERALSWALEKQERGEINEAAVIGAVIHLDHCCDFLNSKHTQMLEPYHSLVKTHYEIGGQALPQNTDLAHDVYKGKLLRRLDCSVIEFMHKTMDKQIESDVHSTGFSNERVFDSVRGVFMEGGPAFKGSGILKKSHIQIAIRNPNCIKGFFLPRREVNYAEWHRDHYHNNNIALVN
jgi:hypothetical protein